EQCLALHGYKENSRPKITSEIIQEFVGLRTKLTERTKETRNNKQLTNAKEIEPLSLKFYNSQLNSKKLLITVRGSA
ncbi:hypothetical protein L9F63_001126, partial [Diploptera punctata]